MGHAWAREHGGSFLLRIEDLDQTRSRAEFVDAFVEDLHWLGIEWDAPPFVQSQRSGAYNDALERLQSKGLAYPCFCTRADIAAALEAPHGPVAGYPGTCRNLPDGPERRASEPHSWRLDSHKALAVAGLPAWSEIDGRQFRSRCDDFDDVILARKDAPAAYHLACVVDDAASGVTLVTRAADLRPSTPIQRLLQILLGLPETAYFHHPLVAHANGRRLAKRDLAPTLAAIRGKSVDGHALAADLLAGKLPLGFAFTDA